MEHECSTRTALDVAAAQVFVSSRVAIAVGLLINWPLKRSCCRRCRREIFDLWERNVDGMGTEDGR